MTEAGLSANAARTPQKAAVVDRDRVVPYDELDRRTNALARVIAACSDPAAPVAAMLPNCVELIETGAAAAKAARAFVPVNWHLKGEELGYLLADSRAGLLVVDASLREHVEAALATVACPVLVVRGDASAVSGAVAYEEAVAGQDDGPVEGAWATPAWMFYTSGTTGRPKGVVHGELHPQAMTMAQQGLMALWGFTAEDVYLLSGPGYHAGPGGYTFTTLFAGGTVVVLPEWDAREWLRLAAEHRVTTTFMTPAHFIRLLEVPAEERAEYDLTALRLVIHAGAPCPVEVKRRMLEALPHVEISELYGASEGGVTKISRAEWESHPGSVGRPWPGVEVRILDPDGDPLPPGHDGLVYVRPAGGHRFSYHDDEAKTRDAWRDDAFTVGDVGHVDADGWLYLTDRASDMVLWGGVNIYPREIEECLHRHSAVVDCAVFGVPDARSGEVLHAVVEVRAPVEPDELRAHLSRSLADFKVPRVIDIVDALPRQPNGKVLKRLLREQVLKTAR